MTANDNGGLRERKKAATREALSTAALRLALEHGPQNVRVDDIAEAAGVSPRTYNNYFSSREAAIVAAVAAERALRVSTALREGVCRRGGGRPSGDPRGNPCGTVLPLKQLIEALERGEDVPERASSVERPCPC